MKRLLNDSFDSCYQLTFLLQQKFGHSAFIVFFLVFRAANLQRNFCKTKLCNTQIKYIYTYIYIRNSYKLIEGKLEN